MKKYKIAAILAEEIKISTHSQNVKRVLIFISIAIFLIYRSWTPFSSHCAIISSGHREDCTSPMCALRRKNIQIRDCPIPPPMVYGSSSLMIAFWKGRSFLSSHPAFFNWESRAFLSTRIPMEDNSNAISRTG